MAMTFKTNLLPDVTDTRELGSSTVRWKINGGGEQTQLLRGDGTWASLSDLGISSAMHFKGTTTTAMSDGLTTAAVTIGGSSYTPSAGDVVLYGDNEFVWSGSAWLKLGDAGSFKTVQTAITNNTGSNDGTSTATRFIYSFSQTANGNISVKTRSIPTASSSTAGITKIGASGGAAAYSHTHSYLPLSGGTMTGWVRFSGGGLQSSSSDNTAGLYFDEDWHDDNDQKGVFLNYEGMYNNNYYTNEVAVLPNRVQLRGFDENNEGTKISVSRDGLVIDDGTSNGIGSNGQVLMSNGSKAYWGTVSTGSGTLTSVTASGTSPLNLTATPNGSIISITGSINDVYVAKSGDTMTGQLYINNTNDIDDAIAPGTAAPLVIGDKTGGHLEFDSNEILAKSDGTTMTKLWLQDGSGPVHIAGVDTDNLVSLYTDGKIQANNNISVKDTNNIGISAYLNVSSAGNQGLYSSGYGSSSSNYTSSAKWIIRRNDAGDTYLGSGKVYVTDGNLYCSKSSATDTYIEATNSTGCRVEIDVSSNGQHGLWSSGYHNGTNYVASALWLVSRSTDGNGYFNGISQSSKYLYITNSNEIRFDIKSKMSTANGLAIGWKWSDGTSDAKITGYSFYNGGTGLATITGSKVYGAVYNDYAEYREVKEIIKPGRCVIETGNGDLVLSTKRLERGCEIISDTYGFGIGETDRCKTPIAVTGRVLAYLLEDREYAKSHIGWPVCSGPNGTVSIMTEEEEEKYPSRIIGTISEIPDYEEWGSDSVKINGRIWIRVR